MNASQFDTSTPEKLALFNAMQTANAALLKVSRKNPLGAFRSPEYKTAKEAYRAYWLAVDLTRSIPVPLDANPIA